MDEVGNPEHRPNTRRGNCFLLGDRGGTLFGELDGTVAELVYLLREPEIINIMFLRALYETATASWITLRVIDITDKII